MENKLGVRFKLIANDKKETNLLSTDTVTILVSKSSTLQGAIMQCIKEKSNIKDPSEITPEHISDICYIDDHGDLTSLLNCEQATLECFEKGGFKFSPCGFTFIVYMKLKEAHSQQSEPVNVYTV